MPKPQPLEAAAPRIPFLTFGLVLGLAAIFWLQLRFGGHPANLTLDAHVLTAEGGVNRTLVSEGEWWRLFTAPLLHANLGHILGNDLVLLVAGTLVERFVGRGWVAGVFAIGALGGSLGSIAYGSLVSVGASGAIMALLAALFVLSYHDAEARHARKLRRFALYLIVPALLPSAAHGSMITDIGAHCGGALAGTAAGALILVLWPEAKGRPPFGDFAAVVALVAALMSALAFLEVGMHFPAYQQMNTGLAPADAVPSDPAKAAQQSAQLVRRYPHDPRIRLLRAAILLAQNDAVDAEQNLRAALAETRILAHAYPPQMTTRLHGMLAVALLMEGQRGKAELEAAGSCSDADQHLIDHSLTNWLVRHGLCVLHR